MGASYSERRQGLARAALLLLALALPTAAYAQGGAQASVAGVVKDSSGDVLPGVTVEVSGPSLIEKVRTGETDGRGFYRIIDLPGGTYTVTFTLQGFTTVRRANVQLEGAFAATINADLNVGAVTETVVVTADTPIVNVQSAVREDVFRRDVITSLPISRDWYSLATLIPGISVGGLTSGQDTGGLNLGEIVTTFSIGGGSQVFGSRGFGEGRLQVDGLSTGGSRFGSGSGSFLPDISNAQEVQIISSGGLGSAEVGGPTINIIPRSGGNTLTGSFYYNFSNNDMQGNNIDEALRIENPGLPNVNSNVIKLQDVNVSVGGPVRKDRLWYFGTYRNNRTDQWVPGVYFNQNANLPPSQLTLSTLYVPDLNRRAFNDARFREGSIRVTWQATQKHKFTFSHSQQYRENNYNGGGSITNTAVVSPEAGGTTDARPQTLPQISWTNPRTNRLLLEGSFSAFRALTGGQARPTWDGSIVRITQTNNNDYPDLLPANASVTTGAQQWANNLSYNPRWRASVAYQIGGHSLRAGYDGFYSKQTLEQHNAGSDGLVITINRLTGARSFTVAAVEGSPAPSARENWVRSTGIYIEDQWTIKRLTLQAALRYDGAVSGYPVQTYGPGLLVPQQFSFPAGKGVLGYRDLTPRVGVAYDLFGDARTALKFNFGHYVSAASNDPPYQNNNPTASLSNTTPARSWVDINNNLVVDCDIKNGSVQGPPGQQPFGATGGTVLPANAAVDSCAAVNLGTFGTPNATTTVTDPSTLKGWNVRPGDYGVGFGIQQQVARGISVELSYRRRWQNNFTYTDNLNIPNFTVNPDGSISSTAYTQYGITSPLDGSTIGGLWDINSNTFGTNNLILGTDDDHQVYTRYHDIDVNVAARTSYGLVLRGGAQFGQRTAHICGSNPDNPGSLRGCHVNEPFTSRYSGSAQYLTPHFREAALAWASDFNLSTTFSVIPVLGVTDAANYTIPTAAGSEFFAQVGRAPLSGISPVVNLRDPSNPELPEHRFEHNLRIGRLVKLAGTRANFGLEVYNIENMASALARNLTYNPSTPEQLATYYRRTNITPARFFKFSVQFDF